MKTIINYRAYLAIFVFRIVDNSDLNVGIR